MISFPIDIGESNVTPEALEELHDQAALSQTGGMYPVGSNGLWHGGVHLSLREGVPVRAPAGGRLVAARLDPDEEVKDGSDKKSALCAYGHTNFILTKHTWPPSASAEEGTPYYMLFMHLARRPLEAVTAMPSKLPTWCTERPIFRLTQDWNLRTGTGTNHAAVFEEPMSAGTLLYPIEDESQVGDNREYQWRKVAAFERDETGFVADFEGVTESVEGTGIGGDAVDTLEKGQVANLDVPVEAGELLWWGGLFGQALGDWDEEFLEMAAEAMGYPQPVDRAPAVHWEVFSPEKVFGLEASGEQSGSGGAGSGDGGSQAASDSTRTDSTRTDSTQTDSPQTGSSQSTAGTEGGEEEPDSFSVPSWTTKIDSGSDLTFNPTESEALDFIKERRKAEEDLPDNEDYTALSLGEKQTIHLLEEGKALRTVAVKYASEWGLDTGGLGKALKSSPVHDKKADKDDFEALQFWSKVDALPSETKVWHYHPATALEALAAKHPWFYVSTSDGRKVVERYEDLRDAVFEANDVSASTAFGQPQAVTNQIENTTVYASRLDERKELATGNVNTGERWAGVVRHGQGRGIYTLLIGETSGENSDDAGAEAVDGIPEMADIHKNVWAALTQIEGDLDSINAYDDAFVSFGPFQQTIGKNGNKGELQGALHNMPSDLFRQYFGRHGLETQGVETMDGVPKGHVSIDGKVLDDADGKRRFQRFEWLNRLVEAMDDSEFRESFLRYGFRRLTWILQNDVTFDLTSWEENPTWSIGHVFRSDLGRALLLDTHINAPAYVWDGGIWKHRAETRFEAWGVPDLSRPAESLTEQQERQLILDLIDERNASGMWQPPVRAAKVLYYAELETINWLVIDAGYSTANEPGNVTEGERDTFLDQKLGLALTTFNGEEINGMDNFDDESYVKGQVEGFDSDPTLTFDRSDLLTLQESTQE